MKLCLYRLVIVVVRSFFSFVLFSGNVWALDVIGDAVVGPGVELGYYTRLNVVEPSGADYDADLDRLYIVSDESRRGFQFVDEYSSRQQGAAADFVQPTRVLIANLGRDFSDVEDLSLGRCPNEAAKCLYIADTGANFSNKKLGRIVVVKLESITTAVGNSQVDAILDISFDLGENSYQDIEAMAVHPVTGYVLLVTKGVLSSSGQVVNQSMYRLNLAGVASGGHRAAELMSHLGPQQVFSDQRANTGLAWVGAIIQKTGISTDWITAMDIHANGTEVLMSTYDGLYTFNLKEASVIELVRLSTWNLKFESVYFYGETIGLISEEIVMTKGVREKGKGHNTFHIIR